MFTLIAGLLIFAVPSQILAADGIQAPAPRTANVFEQIVKMKTGESGSVQSRTEPNRVSAILAVPGTYPTIQAAINAAVTGDIIQVAAGTYVENLIVDKEVEIAGAGAGLTTIVPALSAPMPTATSSLPAGASNLILVQANNVTIHDLTLDGDNSALTSGIVAGGADIDARNGIITNHGAGVYNGLQVYNTTVKNIYLRGIYASSGGTFHFHHNTVQNVQASSSSIAIFNFYGSGTIEYNTVSDANDAIAANWSSGTQFLNNVVTNSGSGVHTDNNGGSGGTADLIHGNTVSNSTSNGYGVWVFFPYVNAVVSNNTVANVDVGLFAWGGSGGTSSFSGNTVDGQSRVGSLGAYVTVGPDAWGSWQSNVSTAFANNSIANTAYGVAVETDEATPFFTLALSVTGHVTSGNAIDIYVTGLGAISTTGLTGNTVLLGSPGRLLDAIPMTNSAGTLHVATGTFTDAAQLDVTKNLSIIGAGAGQTILKTTANTTAGGNVKAEAWIYDDAGASLTLKNLTLDGTGAKINHAVQSRGTLAVEDCAIQNIKWGTYNGRGIVLYAGAAHAIRRTSFTNIERIGIHVRGAVATPAPEAVIEEITYAGKGSGDWLDYGIEFGGGGKGSVTNSLFTGCAGVAASDGSTSGAIMATTYFGAGTEATLTGNLISDCSAAVIVGYDASDVSEVTATGNSFGNCALGVQAQGSGVVNASGNWWGTVAEASVQAKATGLVDFTPWLAGGTDTDAGAAGFQADLGTLYVSALGRQTGAVGRIQEGINLVSGSTVNVLAGGYTENVVLSKSIALIGAGAASTTIDGNGTGNCLTLGANGLTVHGFTLTNGYNGVQGQTSTSAIRNCVIHTNKNWGGSNGVGICLWGDNDNNVIQGNTIYGNDRQGIFVGYQDATKLSTGNRILSNVIHDNGLNTLANGPDASSYGIQLWHGDQSLVQGNAIYNHTTLISGTFGGVGIYLINAQQNSLIGNTVYGNQTNIALWNGGGRAAKNNLIQGNTLTAPMLWGLRTYSDAATTHANFNVFSSATPDTRYIKNGDTKTLDATYNWFDALNPPSTGTGTGIDGPINITGYYATSPTVAVFPASYYMPTGSTVNLSVMGLIPVGTKVKGSDITLNWSNDAAIQDVGTPLEGSFFSAQGGQSFFEADNSSGTSVRVNQSVLDQDGVGNTTGTLPYVGPLFTMEFSAQSDGASTLTLSPVQLRDQSNAPLTVVTDPAGGITLTADGTVPAITDVVVDNLTLSTDDDDADALDDYVKHTDHVAVTANVTDANGLTAGDITADLSGFYGGNAAYAAVNPITYAAGVATWEIASITCLPADGEITVAVSATDPVGNIGTGSGTITADNTAPAQIAGFAAAPGKAKTVLSWTAPAPDVTMKNVLVRFAKWNDYPHYATTAPGFPASPTAGDGTAVDVPKATTSVNHTFAASERGVYYYRAFAYDYAGNYAAAGSDDNDRSTNYVLGDLGDGSGSIPGTGYNGLVNGQDLMWFSTAYFSTETGSPAWNGVTNGAEVDFGPTAAKKNVSAGSRVAIPSPDNAVEFEDLMIFSMNYQQVFPKVVPGANGALAKTFSMSLRSRPVSSEELAATVHLGNDGQSVKGAAVELKYDPAILSLTGIDEGDLFGGDGQGFYGYRKSEGKLRIEAALLGSGLAVEQSGDLATVRFRILKAGDPQLSLSEAEVRNTANTARQVEVKAEAVEVPTTFDLSQNYPNPFNPTTVIKYQVPSPAAVEVAVYNVLGERVATLVNEMQAAGYYTIEWNGRDSRNTPVATGMYIYTMKAGDFSAVKKMMLVK